MFVKNGVENVKAFKVKNWHFGYKYYTGIYNSKKVFIKYNSNEKIILNEVENINYLNDSDFLKMRLPKLIIYKVLKKGAFLIEDFLTYDNLKNSIEKNRNMNLKKVYSEFILIIKEFQKKEFLYLDINPLNIYIDDNDNVLLIDLGFSLMKNKNFSFVGNKRKQKFIISHLNKYSRLERGYIDDAISFIVLSEFICPEFIAKYSEEWKEMNKLSNKLFFDSKR